MATGWQQQHHHSPHSWARTKAFDLFSLRTTWYHQKKRSSRPGCPHLCVLWPAWPPLRHGTPEQCSTPPPSKARRYNGRAAQTWKPWQQKGFSSQQLTSCTNGSLLRSWAHKVLITELKQAKNTLSHRGFRTVQQLCKA